MQTEIQLFKALSDSTRLRMLLLLLSHGELCVCDLMESLQIPQSTASRHLALLRSAGLVDGERRGTWMYYQVVEDHALGSAIMTGLKQHCSDLEKAVEDKKDARIFSRLKVTLRSKRYVISRSIRKCQQINSYRFLIASSLSGFSWPCSLGYLQATCTLQ